MIEKGQVIQLKITEKRESLWEQWMKQSKYEINSQILWEAIELALRFKEIQKKGTTFMLIDPSLLADETVSKEKR